MNFLLLVFGEMKSLICGKKSIFLFLTLGLSLSFYSFHLMYGSIQYTIRGFYNYNKYNTYTIEIQNTEKEAIYRNMDILIEKGLRTALLMEISDDKPLLIGWFGENNNRWFIQNQGSFFNESDYNEKQNVAVIADNMYPYPDVNYSEYPYVYDGQHFVIKGLFLPTSNKAFFNGCNSMFDKYYSPAVIESNVKHDGHNHYENKMEHPYYNQAALIPYTTFEALEYKPDVVRFEFTVTSLKVRENIKNQLTELFPNETIMIPEAADYAYTKEMWFSLLKSIIICIASMINIIGLFVYWQNSRMYVYQVYYLVGAKLIDILKLNLFCWVLLLGISLAVSGFLVYLTKPVMEMLLIDTGMTFRHTMLIYLCSILVSFFMLLPYLIRMRRQKL